MFPDRKFPYVAIHPESLDYKIVFVFCLNVNFRCTKHGAFSFVFGYTVCIFINRSQGFSEWVKHASFAVCFIPPFSCL